MKSSEEKETICLIAGITLLSMLFLGFGCANIDFGPRTDTANSTAIHIDTDGDGLSDRDEKLGWDIAIDEVGYGALATGAMLTRRHVSSDQKLSDTDGDGLTDYKEYRIKTDPRSADTDRDGLTDYAEWNIWISNPISVDTDGDARGPNHDLDPNPALFDGNELVLYQTSPTMDDTDGDGRTDFEEIDHPSRSPLVSDLPKLEMELVDAVDVRLDVTYAEEKGASFQYGTELMESTTTSTSKYNEHSIEAGLEVSVSHEFGLFGGTKVEGKKSFSYGHKWSTTQTSSQTSQESHSKYTTDSRTRTETAASGSMTAGIRLHNPGNIAYKLPKLGIAVRHWEQVWDKDQGRIVKSFRTVATLVPSVGDGITIGPGEATPVLQVEATGLNADRVKELLRRPDSLYIQDQYFELEDVQGLNFDFLNEITATRTASIVIDPGQGNVEEYRIATNVQRGAEGSYLGVTLREILNGILGIEFETKDRQYIEPSSRTNERVLYRIGDLKTDLANPDGGLWSVVHQSGNPQAMPDNIEDLSVKGGDRVLLFYVRDTNGDGVNDLLEQHYGIHADCILPEDCDDDGLNNKAELDGWEVSRVLPGAIPVYRVFSDPANADQDADGWNDSKEKDQKTDPSNPDTDRDGIPDGDDPFPFIPAKVIYVDKDAATGANDGSSWADAYTSLQDALAQAQAGYETKSDASDDVAEIWVADGVYKPSPCTRPVDDQPGDPRDCSFYLVPTVGVYGGFRGSKRDYTGETKREQRDRDPRTNGTLLSGDLNGNDVHETKQSDNSNTVVRAQNVEAKYTVLDGFQIRSGNNTSTTWGNPGGMYVARPLILRNLLFFDNRSKQGPGALTVRLRRKEELTINRCVFAENKTEASSGGAVLLYYNTGSVSMVDCMLQGNKAPSGGAIGASGGKDANRLTLKNSVIVNNSATTGNGGGVLISDGMPIKIVNSKFINNSAEMSGGGLYATGNNEVQIIQSVFSNNQLNESKEAGGGGAIYLGKGFRLAITNSTIINNEAKGRGAGIFAHPPFAILRMDNSILWGNKTKGKSTQLDITSEASWGPFQINTSCIQPFKQYQVYLGSGFGNIFDDPKLGGRDGATPQSESPVIDTGNTYVDFQYLTLGFQTLPGIDLSEKPRLVDGDGDGDAKVDIGAYEYQP